MALLFTSFRQNPHCEGVNRHRILFDARVSAGRQVRYPVGVVRGCKYVISAGLAHGVSHGVEFTLYSGRKQRQDVVVVDDTAVVEDFQTTVTTSVHLGDESFAKLTRVGKVPFYLSPFLEETLQGMSDTATNFRLVEKVEGAKMEVAVEGQLAVFKILDRRVNKFGLTKLPHTVALDNVAQFLNAAAHYYWYLDLANENSCVDIKQQISVDFYTLKRDYDDYGQPLFVPVGPGFCRKDPNSNLDIIDFVVDPEAVYGIKITNNTPWDLYLNAFLFNTNSLSIGEQPAWILQRPPLG